MAQDYVMTSCRMGNSFKILGHESFIIYLVIHSFHIGRLGTSTVNSVDLDDDMPHNRHPFQCIVSLTYLKHDEIFHKNTKDSCVFTSEKLLFLL